MEIKISKEKLNRVRTKLGNICAGHDQCIEEGIYSEDEANALEELNILLVMLLEGKQLVADDSLKDEHHVYYEKLDEV